MLSLFLFACTTETTPPPAATAEPAPAPAPPALDEDKLRKSAKLFGSLPKDGFTAAYPMVEGQVALGKQLYFDKRLSSDDTISCNSCHKLDAYGHDGEATSPGVGSQRGGRNSPTVYNAALHMAQFWDGRAEDVEAQAIGPILNPIEMGMPNEADVLKKIAAIPGYQDAFKALFKDGLTYRNIGLAIGNFERTLITPAPFDTWFEGDNAAMTTEQKLGLKAFMDAGCQTCHNGPLFGGNGYQKLGLVHPWEDADMGRFDVTKDEANRQHFKVPSLRNIEKTGPYFHNGSSTSLDDAITKMAYHQLGKELEADEVESIRTFLTALTGPIDPAVAAPPTLP